MKALRRAALYVCLVSIHAGAQSIKANEDTQQNWNTLRNAGYAAFDSNRFAEALSDFESALTVAGTPEERAMALDGIGSSLVQLRRNPEGAAKFDQALAEWRGIDPAGHRAIETAIHLANAQHTLDRYADAERTLQAALDARPRDSRDAAAVFNALGDLANQQGRYAEARKQFESSFRLSPDAGGNRLDALIGLADVERSMGEWQAAIGHWNQALPLARQPGKQGIEALALRGLGVTYQEMGDLARAEPLLRRAAAIFERLSDEMPAFRPQYAATVGDLGAVYAQEGKRGMAEEAFRRALNLDTQTAADNAPSAYPMHLLALLLAEEKRFGEAAEFAQRSYRILRTLFGDNSGPAASALGTMAFVEERAGQLDEAEHHYAEALRVMQEIKNINSGPALTMMARHAAVLRKLHRGREAKNVEAQVKAFRSAVRSDN